MSDNGDEMYRYFAQKLIRADMLRQIAKGDNADMTYVPESLRSSAREADGEAVFELERIGISGTPLLDVLNLYWMGNKHGRDDGLAVTVVQSGSVPGAATVSVPQEVFRKKLFRRYKGRFRFVDDLSPPSPSLSPIYPQHRRDRHHPRRGRRGFWGTWLRSRGSYVALWMWIAWVCSLCLIVTSNQLLGPPTTTTTTTNGTST